MKQITVLVDNKPGIAADVTQVLADRNINIETLNTESADPHGIINLTVDNYDAALQALRDANFDAISEDAIVICLKDEPGALAKIALRFKEAEINIRSMRIVRRAGEQSLVALVTERSEAARELVKDVAVS